MTLLVDAAPLVALADRGDRLHGAVRATLEGWQGALVLPEPITAEVDHLLGRRIGRRARLAFLDDLAAGRFEVVGLDRDDHAAAVDLERGYADLGLGLADCALVVLAQRLRSRTLLTFDARHFRAVTPLQGGAFTLLPVDTPHGS